MLVEEVEVAGRKRAVVAAAVQVQKDRAGRSRANPMRFGAILERLRGWLDLHLFTPSGIHLIGVGREESVHELARRQDMTGAVLLFLCATLK